MHPTDTIEISVTTPVSALAQKLEVYIVLDVYVRLWRNP